MDKRHQSGGTDFVWNIAKAHENQRKHGISFEDAAEIFHDPLFHIMDASRNEEARQAGIGFDRRTRLLFVVHIEFEGDCIRIISARLASSTEEEIYDQ